MANDIIHGNILHNFDSVQSKHSRLKHAQNHSKLTGDADTNTEFSLTTLSNNFFCANIIPQSQQSI